jgi:hypothetical protein
MHKFAREEDARAALLELPCIHVASDSGKLICTQVLIFGYYKQTDGEYEAVICGPDLTPNLWEQARASFAKHGGRLKNELAPEDRPQPPKSSVPADVSEVLFVREERHQQMGFTMIYRMHKAPDAASAQAFLQRHPITTNHLYIVVETPEGNYGRDIDGIYKE